MLAAACGCCSCLSCCCSGRSAVSPRTAKILYFLIVALSGVLAMVLDIWGNDMVPSHTNNLFKKLFVGCGDNNDGLSNCFGTQSVFRISFALVVFFTFMLVGSLSRAFHLGMWGAKFVFWALLVVVSFFIPYSFVGYAKIAQVLSIFFLIAQVIVLIDMAYVLHEYMSDKIAAVNAKYEGTHEEVGLCQNPWALLYLVLVVVLQATCYSVIIGLYVWTSNHGHGCTENQAFLSITLITGLLYTVWAARKTDKGLLTPSVFFTYATWLCWSAITNAKEACNPMYSRHTGWSLATGVIVAVVSLVYTCYSATSSFPGLVAGEHAPADADMTSALIADGGDKDEEASAAAPAPAPAVEDGEAASPKYWLFHIIMVLASVYMSMVLTNWETKATKAVDATVPNSTAMWMQIICQWVGIVLFCWSIIAQSVLTNRDF